MVVVPICRRPSKTKHPHLPQGSPVPDYLGFMDCLHTLIRTAKSLWHIFCCNGKNVTGRPEITTNGGGVFVNEGGEPIPWRSLGWRQALEHK